MNPADQVIAFHDLVVQTVRGFPPVGRSVTYYQFYAHNGFLLGFIHPELNHRKEAVGFVVREKSESSSGRQRIFGPRTLSKAQEWGAEPENTGVLVFKFNQLLPRSFADGAYVKVRIEKVLHGFRRARHR
jgi:hypothetical protein